MNELNVIISNPENGNFLKRIEWNKDEFAARIADIVRDYIGVVYSDDQLTDAKKARADLNKIRKAISDRRIEVKRAIMVPYDQFEEELKPIIADLDDATAKIDEQIKAKEADIRDKKRTFLENYYHEQAGDLVEIGITFDMVSDPKMMNATYSVDAAEKAISKQVEKIRKDINVIKQSCIDMKAAEPLVMEEYLKNRELGEAITVIKKQRDVLQNIQGEKKEQEKPVIEYKPPMNEKQYKWTLNVTTKDGEEAKNVFEALHQLKIASASMINITVYGTRDQLLAFKDYMDTEEIFYEREVKNAS